jgi:hypothetical protein
VSGPYLFYLDGVEVGGNVEWDNVSFEEILGNTSRTTFYLQDPGYTINPQAHADVKVVRASTGWVLWRGEVLLPSITLPPGMDLTVWKLDCRDYNGQLAERLVGAVDGTDVQDNGFGNFVFIDPFASTSSTDRVTIQQLFDHYFRIGTDAAETSTYVGEYLPAGSFVPIFWTNSTLARVIADLASYVAINVQDWLDPDFFFHHVSIPAWADLAAILAGSGPGLPLMFPTTDASLLPTAPRWISDVVSDPSLQVGCRGLTFTMDGTVMPQQAYVKGATGYTYDTGSPPVGVPAVPVLDAGFLVHGTYQLAINSTTNLYHLDSTGHVASTHTTGAAGGPWFVTSQTVPYGTYGGGAFWRLTSGPHTGLLISQHTNSLGYGSITVTTIPVPPGPPPAPVIGVGGTGWVGGVQDPTMRQAYVEAPSATTSGDRDAIGNQVLYRGATPTLRGSLVIGGDHLHTDGTLYPTPDGWRAGQVVQITDARLPPWLNGLWFVIQRVATKLYPGTDQQEYTIDWGDGPVQRLTTRPDPKVPTPDPAVQLYVVLQDATPAPGTQQVVAAQLVSQAGTAWAIPNRTVNWTVQAVDASYTPVPGQGSCDPPVSTTDQTGKARTTFTAGSVAGLQYFIYVDSPAI